MSKFSKLQNAISWVERSSLPLVIINGDDGLYWVVGGTESRKLIAKGYERTVY